MHHLPTGQGSPNCADENKLPRSTLVEPAKAVLEWQLSGRLLLGTVSSASAALTPFQEGRIFVQNSGVGR